MAKGRIKRPENNSAIKLPRVGMVKTGFKNERGYPQSTDYFLATGKYKTLFEKAYPGKPSTLQIVFWDDNPEIMCEERYEYRDSQGKLYASGDGETFKVWSANDSKYLEYTIDDHPDIMQKVHSKVNYKDWSIILTLRFMLPKVRDIAGFWSFSTKGKASTIPAIRDTFDAMMESRGSVRGVIFDLNVAFAKSQKPGKASRYPVVTLVPNQSQENIEALKGSIMNVQPPKQIEN